MPTERATMTVLRLLLCERDIGPWFLIFTVSNGGMGQLECGFQDPALHTDLSMIDELVEVTSAEIVSAGERCNRWPKNASLVGPSVDEPDTPTLSLSGSTGMSRHPPVQGQVVSASE